MNFITYNHKTLKTIRSGRPTIRFSDSGQVSLSGKAAENLKIKHGDKIELCQNKDNHKEWFIHRTDSEHGFQVRGLKKGHSLLFCSAVLCKKIIKETDPLAKSVGFVISGTPEVVDGEEYFYIITQNPL